MKRKAEASLTVAKVRDPKKRRPCKRNLQLEARGLFAMLPTEVRQMVWEYVIPDATPMIMEPTRVINKRGSSHPALPPLGSEAEFQPIAFASFTLQADVMLANLKTRGILLRETQKLQQISNQLSKYPWTFGHLRRLEIHFDALLVSDPHLEKPDHAAVWASLSELVIHFPFWQALGFWPSSNVTTIRASTRASSVADELVKCGLFALPNLSAIKMRAKARVVVFSDGSTLASSIVCRVTRMNVDAAKELFRAIQSHFETIDREVDGFAQLVCGDTLHT